MGGASRINEFEEYHTLYSPYYLRVLKLKKKKNGEFCRIVCQGTCKMLYYIRLPSSKNDCCGIKEIYFQILIYFKRHGS